MAVFEVFGSHQVEPSGLYRLADLAGADPRHLIGFKTKITTLLSWTVTFSSVLRRGQLTITDQQAFARTYRTAGRAGRRGAGLSGKRQRGQLALGQATGQPARQCSSPANAKRSIASMVRMPSPIAQLADSGARRRNDVVGQDPAPSSTRRCSE